MKNTSQAKRLEINMEFLTPHLKDGQMKENSLLFEPLEKRGCMDVTNSQESLGLKVKKRKREKSVMPESVAKNKKRTSKGKLKISGEITQNTKSSKTLEVESTLKGRDLKPWWTKSCQEMSKNLLSVTEIGLLDLDLNSLSKYAKSLTAKSWFKVKMSTTTQPTTLPKIYYQLLQSLPQNITVSEQERKKENEEKPKKKKILKSGKEKKDPAEKCKKIRLYPSEEERKTLNKWMGCVRWTYNQCLSGVKNEAAKKGKKTLRDYCINSTAEIVQENKWCLETPYDIRNEAMCDLLKAYKTCISVGKKFNISFKSKKSHKDSIVIHCKHFKHKSGPYAFVPKMKSAELLPKDLEYDSRIIKDEMNQYWICIPIRIPLKPLDNQERVLKNEKVASIDPGVRTFATIFGSDGVCLEVGKGDVGRIYRLGCTVDKLQSKWSQKDVNHKKRYSLKKAAKRIRRKIKDLVKEVHNKLIRYLVTNYSIILLPIFETQKMVKRKERKIRSKTARSLITWSHFSFRQRLIHKLNEYKEVKLKIVTEEYTSKTCGSCGHLHQSLGGSKTFKCPQCNYKADRDLNASRNIMLKSLLMSQDLNNSGVETQLLHIRDGSKTVE